MELLRFYRDGELIGELGERGRSIEVGSASSCDVMVDDRAVADRHWLIYRRAGTLVVRDVSTGYRSAARERHVPLGRRVELGSRFELERVSRSSARERSGLRSGGETERLTCQPSQPAALSLMLRTGSSGRSLRIGQQPISVGRCADNDLVLGDRAASGHHCRLEPGGGGGLLLRDLQSRNGTYVNAVRVESALVGPGSQILVGRSHLWVVERETSAVGGEAAPSIIAVSRAMIEVVARAQRAAELSWPVLVAGESGAGKEGIAELVHRAGPRRRKPFVAINAGGVPRDLIEAELFGHERGAFTGASHLHRGVFEQADGGTLFLDEIGELPLPLQARLLRVLETGELRRLGGEGAIRVDVRLVCATHRDLQAMVADGSFREDLYYRIVRLLIEVPALRERPEDVAALSAHFLRGLEKEVGRRELTGDALALPQAYEWPGNARELRNVLAAAAADTAGGMLGALDVRRALSRIGVGAARALTGTALQRAVAAHAGNASAAARALGIPRSTLRDRLRAERLQVETPSSPRRAAPS